MWKSKIEKALWLQIWNVLLGLSTKVETDDLENVEKFLKNTGFVSNVERFKNLFLWEKVEKNLIQVLWNSERMISWAVRQEIPLKIGSTILDKAWVEDSDFLKDKWSSLLSNVATGKRKVADNYPNILAELSEKEVQMLDTVWSNLNELWAINYNETWLIAQSVKEICEFEDEEFDEMIDHMISLNLIFTWDWTDDIAKDKRNKAQHRKRGLICITTLWLNFVKACRYEA